MAKYLITGAAGFIGSQLAYRIWKNNESIVMLDDFSYGKEDNLIFPDHDFRKEIKKIDITDKKAIDTLFETEKFDYVYHVAAITPLPDCQMNPNRALEVNVTGTVNILEASRFYGVKNIIFASTSAVYENNTLFPCKEDDFVSPHLIYSSSKKMAEMLCQNYVKVYGMNVTVLRFANVYGPHLDCLRKQPPVAGYLIREYFYNRTPELHSNGEQARDFIFVEDLIDLALLVKNNEGFDCVNVSSNSTHTINEMDRIIARLMGKENVIPKYREVKHFWAGYPSLYDGKYPISVDILEKEVIKHTECDNNHAKNTYGWIPKVDFEEGIRRTVDFAVKQLSNANTHIDSVENRGE